MKKLTLLLSVLTILVFACRQKEVNFQDPNDDTDLLAKNSMSAFIDMKGTKWNSPYMKKTYNKGIVTASGFDPYIGRTLSINIADTLSVGTYTIPSGGVTAEYTDAAIKYNAVEGVLVITTFDKSIKQIFGNFTFKGQAPRNATKTVDITNGYLAVDYSVTTE